MFTDESRRRQFLGSVSATVGLGLAGCIGSASPTETETPCRADPPSTLDGDRSYPGLSAELRPTTAGEFAEGYERAYQSAVEPGFRSLRYEQEPSVEGQPAGYHVWLACWLRTGPGPDAETPRRPVGDEFYTAAYGITERKITRAEKSSDGSIDTDVDPSDGRTLVCR